jgi:phosphoribulokinase
VDPKPFTIVEGLLGYHTAELRRCYDVRVYLAPPEELRRRWKVQRDTSRRGYTTDQVLKELDKRESDSGEFIRPQERHADMVVSFQPPGGDGDPDALDAEMILRDMLPHPDLSPFIGNGERGITLREVGTERHIGVPGRMDRDVAAEIEEAIWAKLHFATHLRSDRLGEYTIGTNLHRSESLALVQLLILYHLVTAKATIALGGVGLRADAEIDAAQRMQPAAVK